MMIWVHITDTDEVKGLDVDFYDERVLDDLMVYGRGECLQDALDDASCDSVSSCEVATDDDRVGHETLAVELDYRMTRADYDWWTRWARREERVHIELSELSMDEVNDLLSIASDFASYDPERQDVIAAGVGIRLDPLDPLR